MLKGISNILPPELLKILMEMGHGDELVIGDGNFTAASLAQRLVRCDGHTITDVLRAVIKLFPLDKHVERPVAIMEIATQDKNKIVPIRWDEYREIIKKEEPDFTEFESVERFAFYDRSRKAYAIVATGDPEKYANIIIKKGVL